MSAGIDKLISRVKQECDELKLQMALGKAEAVDFLEEQKEQFKGRIDSTKDLVERNPLFDSETTDSLKGRLDELRLQLALGKMETRETLAEQREKIGQSIDAVKDGVAPLRETAGDAVSEFTELFDYGADFFKTKLDALSLNLGLTKADDNEAVADAETEAKKKELVTRLDSLSAKAKDASNLAGEELSKLGHDLSEGISEVRNEIADILKR